MATLRKFEDFLKAGESSNETENIHEVQEALKHIEHSGQVPLLKAMMIRRGVKAEDLTITVEGSETPVQLTAESLEEYLNQLPEQQSLAEELANLAQPSHMQEAVGIVVARSLPETVEQAAPIVTAQAVEGIIEHSQDSVRSQAAEELTELSGDGAEDDAVLNITAERMLNVKARSVGNLTSDSMMNQVESTSVALISEAKANAVKIAATGETTDQALKDVVTSNKKDAKSEEIDAPSQPTPEVPTEPTVGNIDEEELDSEPEISEKSEGATVPEEIEEQQEASDKADDNAEKTETIEPTGKKPQGLTVGDVWDKIKGRKAGGDDEGSKAETKRSAKPSIVGSLISMKDSVAESVKSALPSIGSKPKTETKAESGETSDPELEAIKSREAEEIPAEEFNKQKSKEDDNFEVVKVEKKESSEQSEAPAEQPKEGATPSTKVIPTLPKMSKAERDHLTEICDKDHLDIPIFLKNRYRELPDKDKAVFACLKTGKEGKSASLRFSSLPIVLMAIEGLNTPNVEDHIESINSEIEKFRQLEGFYSENESKKKIASWISFESLLVSEDAYREFCKTGNFELIYSEEIFGKGNFENFIAAAQAFLPEKVGIEEVVHSKDIVEDIAQEQPETSKDESSLDDELTEEAVDGDDLDLSQLDELFEEDQSSEDNSEDDELEKLLADLQDNANSENTDSSN